jgi:hypothetical protein
MALTLDPTLKSAQDGLSHKPILEIISSKFTSDIPYLGQYLNSDLTSSTKPNSIYHSSGRLCLIYKYGATGFKYVYTDPERMTFNYLYFDVTHTFVEGTLCEMADGNIGIVYVKDLGTTRQLRYLIIAPTGEIVHADTLIATYTESVNIIDMPFVILLQNGTYLLVYYLKTISGPSYAIMKRTSNDFITWSAGSECILDLGNTKPYYNPSLLQVSGGDVFLWFDYRDEIIDTFELTNIYYSISSDSGPHWVSTVKITDYDTKSVVGKHPIAIQKVVNQMHMAFYEFRNALNFTKGTSYSAADMAFSSEQRKLYVIWTYTPGGSFWGVSEINVDTWVETRFWDCSTSDPPFPYPFCNMSFNHHCNHGEYPYIPVAVHYSGGGILESVAILNVSTNTIIAYHFITSGTYGVTKNVLDFTNETFNESLVFSWINASDNRLYCVFTTGYVLEGHTYSKVRIGYLEIGDYTWHEVLVDQGFTYGFSLRSQGSGDVIFDFDIDRVFLSFAWSNAPGGVRILSLSEGALVKEYTNSIDPSFPYHGLHYIAYLNGILYGTIREDFETNPDNRGMTEIDITSNVINHLKPTWGDYSDYKLNKMLPISDTEIVILSGGFGISGYGITIFNVINLSWSLINNEILPGLTPNGSDSFVYAVSFDPLNEIIFAGSAYWIGIVAVSKYGAFRSTLFQIGTKNADWIFGDPSQLLAQWTDYDLVMAYYPGELNFYMFWTKQDQDDYRIKWEKQEGSFDVSPYVVNEEVILSRSINGNPASLSFSVSHGYLFDPQNFSSLLSIYLKKSRKLNLRFGEKIGGVDYWQQQGVFVIKGTKINYKRTDYPILGITAEDKISTWENNEVATTAYYEDSPKEILEDIIATFGGMEIGECNFPEFDGSLTLYYQWLEETIKNMLDKVCERFCYFPLIEVDGKVSARKIALDNPINHEYLDNAHLINFTPDDSFSDLTNRIIVVGEGRDLISVIYPEEMVGTLQKTVGWWGGNKNNNVWYSTDGSRRCRNPRLEVVESVKNFNFKLGGGNEYIVSEDSDYRYCTIRIECPDMVAWIVGAVAVWLALKIAAALLSAVPFVVNVIEIAAAVLLVLILSTVCSMANCNYMVWAQPIGDVRSSFQAKADDLELQSELGMIITKKYEDPFCYSVAQCQQVANQEMMVTMLQRKRVTFQKDGHLQDEIGDTIKIKHPYTGIDITLFITEIKRRFRKPSSPNSNDGYFLDDIEGWIVS